MKARDIIPDWPRGKSAVKEDDSTIMVTPLAAFFFDIMRAFRNLADNLTSKQINPHFRVQYADSKYWRTAKVVRGLDEVFRRIACIIGRRAHLKGWTDDRPTIM